MGIIGIDIGGTNIRIGFVDRQHELVHLEKVKTDTVLCKKEGIHSLEDFIQGFIRKNGLAPEAAAIGFPATINRERTVVLQAPNIRGLDHVNVVEGLERALQIPVFIDRDVCMAFYYDLRKYRIPHSGTITAFYIGTGIGNVISIGGRVLTGKHGAACELGHMPIPGNEVPCGCGNVGCVENIAGGKYLARLCRTEFTDTFIGDIFTAKGHTEQIRMYVDSLGAVMAAEINILDPDKIILGGGVLAMAGFPKEALQEAIYRHARKPYPAEDMDIIWVTDDSEKGVQGAALYAESVLQ